MSKSTEELSVTSSGGLEGILCDTLLFCICLSQLCCHTDLELMHLKRPVYSPSGLPGRKLELNSHFSFPFLPLPSGSCRAMVPSLGGVLPKARLCVCGYRQFFLSMYSLPSVWGTGAGVAGEPPLSGLWN